MALTSLKRKPKKAEKIDAPEPMQDLYPWGLRITLEKEELDKLDLTVANFDIGDKVSIVAEAEVVSLRESANQKNKTKSVELQIMAVDLGKPKAQRKSKFKEFQMIRDSQPTEAMKE